MPNDRNAIEERGRSLEDEWALRTERIAMERLRESHREDAERRRLSEVTGVRSPDLVARMRAAGFDADSIHLLFLAPVVGMARADGGISPAEREMVRALSRAGGITGEAHGASMLEAWLDAPSNADELERLLALVRDVLAALPVHHADEVRGRIFTAAERVGRASGGFLGFASLSRPEREFLERIMNFTRR